jgi:hypothetical protein
MTRIAAAQASIDLSLIAFRPNYCFVCMEDGNPCRRALQAVMRESLSSTCGKEAFGKNGYLYDK